MSWDRIRGHDGVRSKLLAAYRGGRLGQSYLFAGPEGIGKRLFALELTRALLCERPPETLAACGSCASCSLVDAGTHPDATRLRTPEGKHELPVDDMRAFCAKMSLKPSRGIRKVGIVEDAEDFNDESANAFLKTLEEPPPGTLLLLIATDVDGQLPTILSRCQVVRFSPLGPSDLAAVLADAGTTDAVQGDRLIRLSGGSAARALALNDPALWAFRESLIEGATAARPNFSALAGALSRFVEEAGKETAPQRTRLSLALRFLVEALRSALQLSLGGVAEGLDGAERSRLLPFAERLGTERLLELIDRCLEADYRVEGKVQPVLVIESILEPFFRFGVPAKVGR